MQEPDFEAAIQKQKTGSFAYMGWVIWRCGCGMSKTNVGYWSKCPQHREPVGIVGELRWDGSGPIRKTPTKVAYDFRSDNGS